MATKPGERRLQILQTLAEMLETPKGEKITTAALAARLECSEAALYRHFASKAQMYEGLIDFIEQSLFSVINQITSEESQGLKQIELIIGLLLATIGVDGMGGVNGGNIASGIASAAIVEHLKAAYTPGMEEDAMREMMLSAVQGANVVYTDIWVSMGEPESVWAERIAALAPYQVNAALMAKAGPNAIFMHCLPAYHDKKTAIGNEMCTRFGREAMEVTDDVFESAQSVVFQEAENRMHTIKAVMAAALAEIEL